jgi:hypothetical protein
MYFKLYTPLQHNVLISQGCCAALGVPVPTPFFLQEYLLSTYKDLEQAVHHMPSLVKIFCTLEITEMEQRFHDDIMGEGGQWWLDDYSKPLSFTTLCQMLDE